MSTLTPHYSKKLIGAAVACVLLVNAAILTKVFYNRSQVSAQVPLSERELKLPAHYGNTKEDSSKRLLIKWSTFNAEALDLEINRRWSINNHLVLSAAHFASFNFPQCSAAHNSHNKKPGWVLMELNGKSYSDYLTQVQQYYAQVQTLVAANNSKAAKIELEDKKRSATEWLHEATHKSSRLFVIDAAASRELMEKALQQYSAQDGALLFIARAEVQTPYNRCSNYGSDYGSRLSPTQIMVRELAVESLYLPKTFASFIDSVDSGEVITPFTAEVHYGRLYEPWVHHLKREDR